MTTPNIRTLRRRGGMFLLGAMIFVGIAACGVAGHHGSQGPSTSGQAPISASSAATKATKTDPAAVAQLKADKYAVVKYFPGFGKANVGYSTDNHYKYEVAVSMKTAQDAKAIVAAAAKDPQPGVNVKLGSEDDKLVVVSATDWSALNSARKAYWSYFKSMAKNSL